MPTYWLEKDDGGDLLWPRRGSAAPPHAEMPEDVRRDYEEAAAIVAISPRGACALLRLALQELMPHLAQPGAHINDDIKALVAGGLDIGVQQALDALRVIGNNAVHPGELDLRDDQETAGALFDVLNYIVEQRIAQPGKLKALYERLPERARNAIVKRDGGTQEKRSS